MFRLANSEYKDQFILKGGFLLSFLLGIANRTTTDLDFSVCDIPFIKKDIQTIIREIIKIDIADNIKFLIKGIKDILEHNQYKGYQILLIGTLENIKVHFTVDLATGDPITPAQKKYPYFSMFSKGKLI